MKSRLARWRLLAIAPVVVVVAVAGLVQHHHGARSPVVASVPVFGSPPSSTAEPVRVKDGLCGRTSSSEPDDEGAPRPWLDHDPTGGVVIWIPGLNDHACQVVRTTIDAAHAAAFVAAVDSAKPWGSGVYNCPADDGSEAHVYLTYAGKAESELVDISLAGCSSIWAPGRVSLISPGVAALGPEPKGLHGGL